MPAMTMPSKDCTSEILLSSRSSLTSMLPSRFS